MTAANPEIKGPASTELDSSSEKGAHVKEAIVNNDRDGQPKAVSGDEEAPMQEGVRQFEAITTTWCGKALIATFICIYICSYNHSMSQQMNSNLAPYVTSAFSQHGLTATTGVLASIVGGVSRLPLAKIINIWGRVEGFIFVNILASLGLLLMAVCPNVETYAAAAVFWSVGQAGMGYIITIIISDITSLRNRMLMFALNSTAYIGNSFAGPAVAQLFIKQSTFRWAFGAFAIIIPFMALPIVLILAWNFRKAKKLGNYPKKVSSGRNWKQSVVYYFHEFDVIGMILIIVGFGLLLLPLSLAARSLNRWKSPHIIAMIVLGAVVLAAFGAWERFVAQVPLFPWKYLKNRTILGAAALACFLFLSTSSWDSYFSSYLQVVHRLSIRDAGYIINIYTIASCTWGPVVGLLIRQSGRYKWIALCAVPVSCLGTGLLIHFRTPGTYIGYIVMTQIFKATASGTLIICEQLAVMAVVPHNEIAVLIAVIGLFSSIGGGVGRSISGAIWTNQLPSALERHLPQESQRNLTAIYGSLPVQLRYEWGSPTRDAIVMAYGEVQRKMLITGASFLPLALASIFLWENVNVKDIDQTPGQVF